MIFVFVFRGLDSGWGGRNTTGSQRNSMPLPYGWDQSLSQMAAAGITSGSTSVPTTPLPGSYVAQSLGGAGNFMGYNLGNHVQPQNPNFYAGYPSNSFSGSANNFPTNPSVLNRSHSDVSKSQITSDGFNLVPNIDYDVLSESDAFFNQQVAGSCQEGTGNENAFKTHKRKSSDLIQLGFEGVLTSEEKEYFSLEYFDPLHKRGRTVSISTPSSAASSSHYFFAKPPEETDIVSKDRNAWVTFDDADFEFGRSDNTDIPDKVSFSPDIEDKLPSIAENTEKSMDDSKVSSQLLGHSYCSYYDVMYDSLLLILLITDI